MMELSLLILVIAAVVGFMLLVGVAVVAAAAMFPKFRRIIFQLSAVGVAGLVILFVLAMLFFSVNVAYKREMVVARSEAIAARDEAVERHESRLLVEANQLESEPPDEADSPPQTTPPPRTDEPAAEVKTSETEPAKGAKPAAPANANPPAEPQRPNWLDSKPGLTGEVFQQPLASGLFVTREECEMAMESKIDAAIKEYARRWLGATSSPQVTVTEELRNIARKQTYFEEIASPTVGPMQQLHVRLEFDKLFRDRLSELTRQATLQVRLRQTLILAGLVLGVLATVFFYLRADVRDAATAGGKAHRRLQFAASLGILAVLVAAMAAWRRLLP